MDAELKKILKSVSLELRHTLEGTYDERGDFHPGDLEHRLNALGVWRDRPAKPLSELSYLPEEDHGARRVVDAYLTFRAEAGVGQREAVAEFVRESAYTWANRLLCLRCMEAGSIIDEVILQKEVYGWRSMVHNRLGRQDQALLATPDEGLFAVLSREFELRARELPTLFNPKAPAIALRPSLAALKKCIGLLSGTEKAGSNGAATDAVFAAPDALGWAYQYWNAEEKDRVFEKVRTERGAKIEGADIIPATQLYTEPYMVKFLVQNSLGALWMGMHPNSNLADSWEYYVRDADRAPVEQKRVREITFLDPACGSGHFHLEAFDLLFAMYEEEGELGEPESICAAILNHNLYGVDIDERAVQIAQAALWMKAKETAWDLEPEALTDFHHHFVATNIRLPRGKNHLEAFLRKHPEDLPLRPALETVFEGLENAHELGSLLQLEEPVEKELRFLRGKQEEAEEEGFQSTIFAEMGRPRQGKLPVGVESYEAWKDKVLRHLRGDFEAENEAADLALAFFGQGAGKGLALFDILAHRYDVVAANPPYMGSYRMGSAVLDYVKRRFSEFSRDLYSCFIARGLELTHDDGLSSFVTLDGFMYLSSFNSSRQSIVRSAIPQVVWHLGGYAFAELGDHVPAVLTVFRQRTNSEDKSTYFRRSTGEDRPEKMEHRPERFFEKKISMFERIPGQPWAYWLPDDLLQVFSTNRPVENRQTGEAVALPRRGLDTGDVPRFVRCIWEVFPCSIRNDKNPAEPWVKYQKGGDTSRWVPHETHVVMWENEGTRIKLTPKSIVPNEELYFQESVTFSRVSRTGINAKVIGESSLIGCNGPGIIPISSEIDAFALAAILNSNLYHLLQHILNQSHQLQTGNLADLPMPPAGTDLSGLSLLASRACHLSSNLLSKDITSQLFAPNRPTNATSLSEYAKRRWSRMLELEASLLVVEASVEDALLELMDLVELKQTVYQFVEQPTGWFPDKFIDQETIEHLLGGMDRILHEGGPDSVEDEADSTSGDNCLKTPQRFSMEAISRILETNPQSICRGSRDIQPPPTYIQDSVQDLATTIVLRLLGYRWPEQIKVEESTPAWVDKDGIIPISSGGHGEVTLYDRVRERVANEFSNGNTSAIEREFADTLGEPLAEWLSGYFCVRHVSQFKKRPIAWQLETTASGRGRGNPAFSCLIYYHRLDADLLPKIRSQYIRDLRRGYETEQRTLRQVSSRTANQDARLLQLDAWLDELNAFDEKLEQVSVSGFGDTPALQAQLRQYAIDDAMQSLKAVWLRRLADVVAGGPLRDWQLRADKTGIHPELGDWIASAIDTLHHHCASVGAKSPQTGKLTTDPDSRALAAVIGTQAAQMVQQAIALACDAWFDDLNSHVLRPALGEINELKAQVTELEEKLNDLGAHETRARYDAEQAIKSLKARISKLTKARNEQRKMAKELREHIEGWTYPEAAGWTGWLGTQPLFDQFAGPDGQKPAPRTIADFVAQESRYDPDINDGVRVNIAPVQKAGLLAATVLDPKDVDKAIADRADWRADERRWCREGKLPKPGWWPTET